MRPFPIKTPIGPVQKITPKFIGYNRGITPTEVTRTQQKPTSQTEIKVLRSTQTNTIPLVNINDRYRAVTHRVNFSRDNYHRRPTPALIAKPGKKSITISTYNFE